MLWLFSRLLVVAALAVIMLSGGRADAKRATCEEIAAAQSRGLTAPEIKQELRTTDARIQSCVRLAEMHASQEARRAEVRARRADRLGHP